MTPARGREKSPILYVIPGRARKQVPKSGQPHQWTWDAPRACLEPQIVRDARAGRVRLRTRNPIRSDTRDSGYLRPAG
eukprot:625578-Prymnesium_polylepis.1